MATEKRLIDAKKLPYSIAVDDNGKQIFYVKAEDIDNAPTVDAVEVVYGQWVYSGEPDDDGNIQAHCSVCDAGDRHATSMIGRVPYCWKCGAKMDGERRTDG